MLNLDIMLVLAAGVSLACTVQNLSATSAQPEPDGALWQAKRQAMVQQLKAYHITNACVLQAMGKVRRHMFIPAPLRQATQAYGDHPCSIGQGQTISQPYIVAYMTERLQLKPGEKVLEIGTGSGYQAAVLAECGAQVYSIEIIPELARHARQALDQEGYSAVQILTGDGYLGWPEHTPFDAIILTCAPDEIPAALLDQLRDGGRIIAPVGAQHQRLVILRKESGQIKTSADLPVRFVPMVREHP